MDELSRVALVGTQQAGTELPAAEPGVQPLFDRLPSPGRERELLLRAGAGAVYRRAGVAARRIAELPAAAPAESQRACGPALTGLLHALLTGTHGAVLLEALELLSAAGLRLPPELLPDVLDVSDRDLRERLRPVIGERGRWLARLEARWAWARTAGSGEDALPADADARWQEAGHEERKALLARARRVDLDRSRSWLAATWSQERADHRAEMLALLEIGLSLADEPFLVAALDDRSAAVRMIAARLLWRLPGSALAETMRRRAGALIVAWRPARGSARPELEVRLPPGSFDPAWSREGLTEQPPAGQKMGRRQWWLAQMIAAVPPAHWESKLSAPAAALVAAAEAHDFADILIDGLTTAALAHGSDAWFEPLWQVWLTRSRPGAPVGALRSALLSRMPGEAQARRACELLASGAEDITAVHALARPWPAAVADAFLAGFAARRRLETTGGPPTGPAQGSHPWEGTLRPAALALPPGHLARTLPIPEPGTGDWVGRRLARAIEEFHAVLDFRRRLHEEIRREHEQRA